MQQPRPYGRFAGQTELSGEDAAAVDLLARQLSNFKSLSDLPTLKRVVDLPSGRIATAIDAGGVFRILISEQHERADFKSDGKAQTNIPMLFSGRFTSAVVRDGEGVGLILSEQTRLRIAGYKSDGLPMKEQKLQRFVVEYAPAFRYFEAGAAPGRTITQYARQRPTWYSGAMAEVIQVVGGYGNQDLRGLPDTPVERAQMKVPEKYLQRLRTEVSNMVLPGYTGFPNEEGQFQYDYKHAKTHAVSFDGEGSPWLVQISAKGVFAMPLPMVPATTTKAFADLVKDKGDTELEALVERFGGMPSGESFPTREADFEAWRRAGVIVKVCDCSDFYEHQAFYTACGWAFNSQGSEGFNTCHSFDGQGLMQGHSYSISLKMGAAKNRGTFKMRWEFEDEQQQRQLNAYLAPIYEALSANGARERAMKYKIRRSELSDILKRASSWNGRQPDLDHWENLTLMPIASHSGNVARVASGPLYIGGKKPTSSPALKFPELRGEGCETFVMVSEDYSGGPVPCDTIVFGCYVNDQLQVIKYFYNETKFQQDKESTFEEVMIVGQWEEKVTSGLSGLVGNFYTTSFDDRQELPETTVTTTLTGRDKGYGQPIFHTPGIFTRLGSLARARYYTHHTKRTRTKGFHLAVAVCVPVFARDCILYAYKDESGSAEEVERLDQYGMLDPNSYQLWCHDNIYHYMDQTQNGNLGSPPSKDGTPVYVDTHLYNPTESSDFADGGNWFNLPPGGFLDVTDICGPYTSRFSNIFQAGGVLIGGEAPGFEPFSSRKVDAGKESYRLSTSIKGPGSVEVHRRPVQGWYWEFSPDQDGKYFYQDACWVTFGSSSYASVYETNAAGLRSSWGKTALADDKGPHHFAGVINE